MSLAPPDPYFEVRVEAAGREAVAGAVLGLFAQAREELGRRFGAFPEGKLLVRVIPAARFTRQVAPGLEAVQRASGVVVKLELDRTLGSYRGVVFHEYAHFLVRQKTGGRLPPRWLNEGMAMLAEGEALPLPWYKRVSTARKAGELLGPSGLEEFGARAPARLPLAYAQAALMVEHLVAVHGEAGLPRLLEALAGGAGVDAALRKVFGHDTAGLVEAWKEGWAEQLRRRLALARARREADGADRQPWGDEAGGESGP